MGSRCISTPTEFELRTLIPGPRPLTHSTLLGEVWGPAYEDDVPLLRVHIANLRRKIEHDPANPHYVTTDLGIRYPVRRLTGCDRLTPSAVFT